MEENNKYAIEMPVANFGPDLIVGPWFAVEACGLITPINGPYCSWPKAEPRYFRVTINEK